MASSDEIRENQRAAWDRLSAGWDKWDALIMEQLAPIGDAMIDALGVAEDQQHLDIACGTGEPGITLALRAPRGHVVLTDLSSEMLEVAARRAAAQGATNCSTKVCSADDLPFGDATFDSVSVRLGYMFFPDAAAATAEFVRVLEPGGRVCAAVWIEPTKNPWTTITMRAIETEVELPPPDPNGPHMYRCAAPGFVSALYESAGLVDVREWEVPVELVTTTPTEYWEVISEHVSSAVAALQRVDDAARARIAETAIAEVADYERDGMVRVPGMARCIIGTKR